MALIDELKQQKAEIAERLDRAVKDVQYFDGRMADLLLAISALEPTPADLSAEQETAPAPVEIQIPEEGLGSSLIAMGYGDDDIPTEHISILTGDPAIEPESGLHGEASETYYPTLEEQAIFTKALFASAKVIESQSAQPSAVEPPALNEAMQDERELPITEAIQEVEAATQPQPTEGYAPVTNPEADTIARAYEYYSPEKMGDRNRSVFDIFRHKREDA